MGRQVQKLNALSASRMLKPGKHPDGNGLYLQISKNGSKSWLFRYMMGGKAREMGLGSASTITLSEARSKTLEGRKLLIQGIDPIDNRKICRAEAEEENAKNKTFDECADEYFEINKKSWGNKKHELQWISSISTYASPIIGKIPVFAIETQHVMRVLEPIWRSKTETASRLRGRIESVLNWAKAHGYRKGENPAQWKGHLENVLPKRGAVRKVKHFPAIGIDDIQLFIAKLREQKGTAAQALEFLILTATRTNEVLGAMWSEIDFLNQLWTIPAERMKAKKVHKVPLSEGAINILTSIKVVGDAKFIFQTVRKDAPLSNVALLAVLRRMNFSFTVHGFRSTFRDWAAERTNFSREVAEAALAHTVRDKVEAAYLRSELIDKRRLLMAEWQRFINAEPAQSKVLELRGAKA